LVFGSDKSIFVEFAVKWATPLYFGASVRAVFGGAGRED
jgi:hypothetical protein